MIAVGRLLLIAVVVTAVPRVAGADWPTWRGDAARSASTEESLPATLALRWTRALPPPAPAWPAEPRLHFDAGYEPIVAGGQVYVASAAESSLTAYSLADGRQRWKFFAEGPIRFAPVATGGRVWFGADDGRLYCLSADGRLLWKQRVAPAGRPDYRHLGNNRLVSFWPVRGGPVLADGVLYAAAGIWPTMDVFVAAFEAASGRLVWRNDRLGRLPQVRVDHNALTPSGLSPQGYLAIAGPLLLVPNGRSMPAGVDRATGELRWYVQGYRHGDCRVTAGARYAFVGDAGVVDLQTGREVGSRWLSAGSQAPEGFDAARFHLFEGPIHGYKFIKGCSWRSVLTGGVAYDFEQGELAAHDVAAASISEYDSRSGDRLLKPWRWDPLKLWSLALKPSAKGGPTAIVRAGGRLYAHGGGLLTAAELGIAGAPPKVAWQAAVAGTPHGLAAAEGCLFVTTAEGTITCLAAASGAADHHGIPSCAPLSAADRGAGHGPPAGLTDIVGEGEGYCVLAGIGDASIVDSLLRYGKRRLLVIDPDAATVDALRRRYLAAGLIPRRIELVVARLDGGAGAEDLRLPPYLAEVLVSAPGVFERWQRLGVLARWLDCLRPYGGVAVLAGEWHGGPLPDGVTGERRGGLAVFRREGPLPGAAAWTHESADAARSYYSHDRRVKAPMAILWYGDGDDHGFWKEKDYGTGVKPQVAGGRLVAFQVNRRTLTAYDVYTGRRLWSRPVPAFTRYATMDDGVYVAGGGLLEVLDPTTGEPRRSHRLAPAGDRCEVADIRVGDDTVVVATAAEKSRAISKGLWDSGRLVALDRATGARLWERAAAQRFNLHALAMGEGLVFCVDSAAAGEGAKAARRGELPKELPSTVLALDGRSGRPRWTATVLRPYRTYGEDNWLGVQGKDDWLAYHAQARLLLAGKQGEATAYDAATGKEVWRAKIGGQPLILRGETFLAQHGQAFYARTGSPAAGGLRFTRGGCNYAVANEHLLFVRDRSAGYIDLQSQARCDIGAVRSGCSNSLIAADGLLNVPNFAVGCVCNYPVQTSFAMMPWNEAAGGNAPPTGAGDDAAKQP